MFEDSRSRERAIVSFTASAFAAATKSENYRSAGRAFVSYAATGMWTGRFGLWRPMSDHTPDLPWAALAAALVERRTLDRAAVRDVLAGQEVR